MDCHVFRRLCDALCPLLLGARIEKIQQPAPGLTAFSLFAGGRRTTLFLLAGRQHPFLFLSSFRLPAPPVPPAFVMRLRKYFSGRRITGVRALWPERRLLLRVREAPGPEEPVWLDLDLREGPRLLAGEPPALPDDEAALPETSGGVLPDDPDWRKYPAASPALRRTLALLEPMERLALVADLRGGGGDLFAYLPAQGQTDAPLLSAWPLPESLRGSREERVFASPLEAASLIGEARVRADLAGQAGKAEAKTRQSAVRRLDRLLARLEDERLRLREMAEKKRAALALQAELYRFAPDEKRETAVLAALPAPLALDPSRTVRENMAALFHQAERGERGGRILEQRIEALRREREAEAAGAALALRRASAAGMPSEKGRAGGQNTPPRGVQAFRSAGGFLLLRGRDAAGNAALLRLAAPHDFWLHAGGAAGAHVILRRDHAAHAVPEADLLQAGRLALEKSERQGEATADVIVALARSVRPVKGGRQGAVRIDAVGRSLSVTPAAVTPPDPLPAQNGEKRENAKTGKKRKERG